MHAAQESANVKLKLPGEKLRKTLMEDDLLNMEDDLLNVEEVAAYLKVSPKTIYRLLKRGEIPAARIGHHWRFDRKTINTWVSRESMKNLRDIA